jgi:hypothetical protein
MDGNLDLPERLRLYTPAELAALPEPTWLVEPFIPEQAIVILFGPSSTYKSFVAVDWGGRAPGLVVYFSAEGSPQRFGARVTAWERTAGRPSGILCHPYAVNLLGCYDQIATTLTDLDRAARLVIVDTTARNTPGADENSTQDTGRLVGVFDKLKAEFGCSMLGITHTGHQNSDRERGSSALRGAADVSIRAKRTRTLEVHLECAKMRDAEEFDPVVVRFEPIGGSLVAVTSGTAAEMLDQEVAKYLVEHPDASQREVEQAVGGHSRDVRAAYKRQVRPVRPEHGRTPGQSAATAGPLKGPRPQPHDPTLEDGGW